MCTCVTTRCSECRTLIKTEIVFCDRGMGGVVCMDRPMSQGAIRNMSTSVFAYDGMHLNVNLLVRQIELAPVCGTCLELMNWNVHVSTSTDDVAYTSRGRARS